MPIDNKYLVEMRDVLMLFSNEAGKFIQSHGSLPGVLLIFDSSNGMAINGYEKP